MQPPPPATVDWKLIFHQLFAAEMRKEHVLGHVADEAAALDRLLAAHSCYTPLRFDEALDRVLAARTSEEAYEARRAVFEDPRHRRAIAAPDLERGLGNAARSRRVRRFLELLDRCRDEPIAAQDNFFSSRVGQAVSRAFAADRRAGQRDAALVLVPGYAAHTIPFPICEELVHDANVYFGRPARRALVHEEGIDLQFEPHTSYYDAPCSRRGGLDVLHPLGRDLGNTTGRDADTADALEAWLRTLPERYDRARLILFGYSKGAPIALELLRRHPEIGARVLGVVTFGGVLQGTHVARQALERAQSLLRGVPLHDFVERLRRERPDELARVLSPLFAHVDLSWLSLPRLRAALEALGHDVGPLEQRVDRLLEGPELLGLLDGMRDLTPLARTRWNLRHLHDGTLARPTFLFTLSALTDVRTFVDPLPGADGAARPSLLAPQLTADGDLDLERLNLDALFLYLSSLEGFRCAPGGLYDTQVELAHTKPPLLDRRPLRESLTAEEIAALWEDAELRAALRAQGVTSVEQLARRPRCELLPAAQTENIHAVDLGELKGHHWSLFIQALRPPPQLARAHAAWDFPRKALMRALLQVLALYQLVAGGAP